MSKSLEKYFSGEKLYGDDFTIDQIKSWVDDEKEGYAELGAKDKKNYKYRSHKLNIRHGFSHLGRKKFNHAVGLGAAYGDEFIPVAEKIALITVIDPSDSFSGADEINGVPCKHLKPRIDGNLPFKDGSVDLITCFSVMHHIPNVSKLIRECHRILSFNGVMLLREPIVSMGDWTRPRVGLTKRERGIPLGLFIRVITNAGFRIKRKALCGFPIVPKITKNFGIYTYNNNFLVLLDELMCKLFFWNTKYHRTKIIHKIGPTAIYFILEKDFH